MATLTINTTAGQDARIVSAFGKYLNTTTPATYDQDGNELTPETPRNATGAEVKAAVINFIKQVVFDQERIAARQAADASIEGFDPS